MRHYLASILRPHWYPLLGYIGITAVFLFPAFIHINAGLWGFRGDNFFVLWVYWFRDFAVINHLNPDYSYYIGYPFGENIKALSEEIAWVYPLQFLIFVLGPFIAFNLINIISFILGGFFAYLFCLHLTGRKFASFVAGLIFTLAPYHFWQSYTHLSLGITFWLPLYYWSLFKIWEKPTLKRGIVAGVLFGVSYFSSFYYGYFNLIITTFFGLGVLVDRFLQDRRRVITVDLLKAAAGFALPAALAILPSFLAFRFGNKAFGAGAETVKKPLENLFGLSARPWDYLIPAPNHPLLASFAAKAYAKIRTFGEDYKFISAFLPERVLYLGWTTVIFSVVGFGNHVRSSQKSLVLMLGYLVVVTFLFSMPPVFYLGGHTIYFPSYFTYQLNNFARAYSRISVLLLLFLLPLFVWGYDRVKQWFSDNTANLRFIHNRSGLFAKGVLIIVLIEFLNFPPFYFTDMTLPGHYAFLKNLPGDFGIVEYPKSFDMSQDINQQFEHGKRVFNMNSNNPYYPVFDKIDALTDPTAPMVLDDFNIHYVVLHISGEPHPIDETWMHRFATSYPKFDKGDERQLVYEGDKAVVYKLQPTVKAKVVVLSSDSRIPSVTIPSGLTWDIDEVANLVFINMDNDTKKVKVSFDLADPSSAGATLVNYESDIRTFFAAPIEVGKNQLVIPVNTLAPLTKLRLTNLKISILDHHE